MPDVKEFHYNESDIKGSANLIDDCKNHYTYLKSNANESDIDVIINGVKNNASNVDIIRQLPNVTADNLHSIICGIKDVRNNVEIDEIPIFQKHMYSLLHSFGFDINNYKLRTKVKNRLNCCDEYSLLLDVLENFVKFCNSANQDVIDLIFNSWKGVGVVVVVFPHTLTHENK